MAILGAAHDITVKHFCDLLRDVQPKADALRVQLLRRLQKPKQLEQLRLVHLLDANARINDLHFKERLVWARFHNLLQCLILH